MVEMEWKKTAYGKAKAFYLYEIVLLLVLILFKCFPLIDKIF